MTIDFTGLETYEVEFEWNEVEIELTCAVISTGNLYFKGWMDEEEIVGFICKGDAKFELGSSLIYIDSKLFNKKNRSEFSEAIAKAARFNGFRPDPIVKRRKSK